MERWRRGLAKFLVLVLILSCMFQPGMTADASILDIDSGSGGRQEETSGGSLKKASDSNASPEEKPEDIEEDLVSDTNSGSGGRQEETPGGPLKKASDSNASPEEEPEEIEEEIEEDPSPGYIGESGRFETATPSDAQLDIAPNSLFPLEEKFVDLDLTEYSWEELKAIQVQEMLRLLVDQTQNQETRFTVEEGQKVVLVSLGDTSDIYRVIEEGDTLDLTEIDMEVRNNSYIFTMELLVGTGEQLDYDADCYSVTVHISLETITAIEDSLTFGLTKDGESDTSTLDKAKRIYMDSPLLTEKDIPVTAVVYYIEGSGSEMYNFSISSVVAEGKEIDAKLYQMSDFLASDYYKDGNSGELPENELSWTVTIQGNKDPGNSDDENVFCIVYSRNGKVVAYHGLTLAVHRNFSEIVGKLYAYEDGQMEDITKNITGMDTTLDWTIHLDGDNVYDSIEVDYQVGEFALEDGYSKEGTYYYVLDDTTLVKNVEAGRVGGAAGMDDDDMEDVTEQAIPEDKSQVPYGYEVDFREGNRALKMTLEDGNIYKYFIKIGSGTSAAAAYDPAPVRGVDTYFQLTGIAQPNENYYAVVNRKDTTLDTYCGYGYQSMFLLNKSFDLSKTKITFSSGTGVKVCVNGEEQESKQSVQDFSSGEPVCYEVHIGDNMREYQVTVERQAEGPKLFVNGPSEREIFLDKYFGYEHSILIANIGDQELTGLKVELVADHVKMDDYWTVGGGANDSLEKFQNTKGFNVAKIILVPDGIGEINGTLRISADNQDPVEIKLTGYAGDPHIITETETLDDAVKGNPYYYEIEHSKLPAWNDVTFRLVDGELPQGLYLDSKTGEISGTPEETGDFRIEVGASYRIDEFDDTYD